MSYTISKIVQIVNGTALQRSLQEHNIIHLVFDSRRIQQHEGSLFFALVTERADGHKYVQDTYDKGVRHFIVSKTIDVSNMPNADIILVSDTLQALQALAAYHRAQFQDLIMIAITGSNGKTIVKEWLYGLLRKNFGTTVMRSPKSYNSQIGVALSLWQIRATDKYAIIEAGVSGKGEMYSLKKMIGRVDVGIFTNLYAAHDGGFSNRNEKFAEKWLLFDVDTVVICPENLIKTFPNYTSVQSIKTYGENSVALKIIENYLSENNRMVEVRYYDKKIKITIPFTDEAAFQNSLLCFLAAAVLGIEPEKIIESIMHFEPIEMRLSLKTGDNNCIIIDDAHSNDINSLAVALDYMTQQSGNHSRTVILSDILESNEPDEQLYNKVAKLLTEKKVTKIIGIGKKIKILKRYLNSETILFSAFNSTEIFLEELKNNSNSFSLGIEKKIKKNKKNISENTFEITFENFSHEIILVKGARIFGFERISNLLEQKVHETILEINLSALIHNFQIVKQTLKPETRIMAMVKASAYGAGGDEVARALVFNKVNYLAVAYTDEGVALRKAGINVPIMVMNPEQISFSSLLQNGLEPEIYSLRMLKSFLAVNNESVGSGQVHLKLNTGMNRLGFDKVDLEELKILLHQHPELKIASIFTHLAATDDVAFNDFTRLQIQRFSEMYEIIVSGLSYKPWRHVLNSNGTLCFPEFQFEMVRLGITLYGIGDENNNNSGLQTVMSLKATISQIRSVPKSETIGYSRKGKLNRDSVIATISIGYADGLHRKAGNHNFSVWLHHKTAPIIGNVCMDMTMIDITDIPEAKEGDKVEIFGTHISVQNLANKTQTIPYEIFTSISPRVKRIYFQEWQ